MPTEREKRLAGELYDTLDAETVAARERARDLCAGLNATRESQQAERRALTRDVPDDVFAAGNPRRVIRALENAPVS